MEPQHVSRLLLLFPFDKDNNTLTLYRNTFDSKNFQETIDLFQKNFFCQLPLIKKMPPPVPPRPLAHKANLLSVNGECESLCSTKLCLIIFTLAVNSDKLEKMSNAPRSLN